MKLFFFRECPCISMNAITRDLVDSSLISPLIWVTTGWSQSSGSRYFLFKSFPLQLVRQLPIITPSGLIIGTILRMVRRLSSTASLEEPVMKLRKPYIMQDELDSPGWTLAVTTRYYFRSSGFSSSLVGLTNSLSSLLISCVIVSRGTCTPDSDLHSWSSVKNCYSSGSSFYSNFFSCMQLRRLVQVQGTEQAKQVLSPFALNSY